MPSILAIDQGTTSSRALVIHEDGQVLAQAHREFPQHFPEPGWVEHDPRDLLNSTLDAVHEAVTASGERPVALGITNQRETVVFWDRRTLEPVAPAIVWQDRRTSQRCAELRASGVEAGVRKRTGLVLDPYFSATKLEWLLNEPGIRTLAGQGQLAAGTVDSWLIARLTKGAVHVTDHTNASRTMLYDLATREWNDELLNIFHVPREVLPAIVASSGIIGEAHPDVLGFSCPIAGVAGDQQAALFGQGCTTPGAAKNTYGTGAFLLLFTGAAPPEPPAGLLATAACGPGGTPGYALEGSVFIAGAAIQWLRDGLRIIESAGETEAMARSVPDSGGVHFVPAFVGLGSPYWEPDARGTITGITRGTTRSHLARAALESIGFSAAELLQAMSEGAGLDVPFLRVDGGATANAWLMQFQADILGVPVERPDVIESTALGAAALAGIAMGVWPSEAEFVECRLLTRFEPQMSVAERDARFREWHRAVRVTLEWARQPK